MRNLSIIACAKSKTLVKDVKKIEYSNPDNDSNEFQMVGWLEKLVEDDDVNGN